MLFSCLLLLISIYMLQLCLTERTLAGLLEAFDAIAPWLLLPMGVAETGY
jgi:hypothetical protein